MHNNDFKRIDKLLTEYFKDNLSNDSAETIKGWLVSDDHTKEKELLLYAHFLKEVKAAKMPDQNTIMSFEEAQEFLNLSKKGQKKQFSPKRVKIRHSLAAAASLLILIAAGMSFTSKKSPKPEPQEMAVTVIENAGANTEKTTVLPDGSTITLTGNSEISYNDDFSNNRSVSLKGEGVFKIVKATDENEKPLPFTVSTNHLTVNVYGTVFRISDITGSDKSSIALYDGKVGITANGTITDLRRGEKLSYNCLTKESSITLIPAKEMKENGFMSTLRFDNSSLEGLILALQENYGVAAEIPEGVSLTKGGFSADFEGEPLEEALNMLTMSSNSFTFKLKNNKIVITKK